MQLLLPFFRVEPVVTTLQEVRDNITIIGMTEGWGSFCVEISNQDELLKLVDEYHAILWTKDLVKQLAESLCEESQPRCKCGARIVSTLNCHCGTYTWCENSMDFMDPGNTTDEICWESRISWWDHADHDCFPACCQYGHIWPRVTPQEMDVILRTNTPPPQWVTFLEGRKSKRKAPLFRVNVRCKSRQQRRWDEEGIRKRFNVQEVNFERNENEEAFVQLFLGNKKQS